MKVKIILVVEGKHISIEDFCDDLKRIRDKDKVVFLRKEIEVKE